MLSVFTLEVTALNEIYLSWRIEEYSVLLKITRTLNVRADTALYLTKLYSLVNKLVYLYGYKNVKTVVAHTIRFRKIDKNPSLLKWAETSEHIPFERDIDKRNYHELVLKCTSKTVLKIARQLMLYEILKQRSGDLCVN